MNEKKKFPTHWSNIWHDSSDIVFSKFDLKNPRSKTEVRSHSVSIIQSIHIEVKVQGSIAGPTSYPTHIPFVPYQLALSFLRYGYLKMWPWKSKVKVIGQVKSRGHTTSSTSIRCISFLFHINQPNHSCDMTNSMFYCKETLEKHPWEEKFTTEFLQNCPTWEARLGGYGYKVL